MDYELDKSKPSDGSRAIEIVRGLTENDHFNLVVVHTSEDELDIVQHEFVIGLMQAGFEGMDEAARAGAEALIETFEIDGGDLAGLRGQVGGSQYLYAISHPNDYVRVMMRGDAPYAGFSRIAGATDWSPPQKIRILNWLLERAQQDILGKFWKSTAKGLEWSETGIDARWIKTDSTFLAFARKAEQLDIFDALTQALKAWNPAPSRLFLAKLRAEVDEYGVIAQNEVLKQKRALAYGYKKLLSADDDKRRSEIGESVQRHSAKLIDAMETRLSEFAANMVEKEVDAAGGDFDTLCKAHFGIDLSKDTELTKAQQEHNAYICSMEPVGWHLTTGHVLDIDGEYWVCLSPACDLVPGQAKGRRKGLGGRTPFAAVRLTPRPRGAKQDEIQSNLYLFLSIRGNVQVFHFHPDGKSNAEPHWRKHYAEQEGIIQPGNRVDVSIVETGKTRLVAKKKTAEIVSQLRYEYALNLQQKLSRSMTRVGLSFVNEHGEDD